jgi:hypothetical protein
LEEINKLREQVLVLKKQRDMFRTQRNKAREQRDKNALIIQEYREKKSFTQNVALANTFFEYFLEEFDLYMKNYQYKKASIVLEYLQIYSEIAQSFLIKIRAIRLTEKLGDLEKLQKLTLSYLKEGYNHYLEEVLTFYLYAFFKLQDQVALIEEINSQKDILEKTQYWPLIKLYYRLYANQGNVTKRYFKRLKFFYDYLVSSQQYYKNSFLFREYLKMKAMLEIGYTIDDIKKAEKLVQNFDDILSQLNLLHLQNSFILGKIQYQAKYLVEHTASKIVQDNIFLELGQKPLNQEIKVLLIYSGQVRGFKKALVNFDSQDKLIVDTIWNVWDNTGVRVPDNSTMAHYKRVFSDKVCNFIENKELYGENLYNTFPFLKELLLNTSKVRYQDIKEKEIFINNQLSDSVNHLSIKIDSEEEFEKSILPTLPFDWQEQKNQAKMMYLLYKSFSLAQESTNIEDYDFIIRARPDLDININIENLKKQKFDGTIYLDVVRKDDYGDRLAIGKPKEMFLYNSLFKYIDKYTKENKNMIGVPYPVAHKMFSYYLYTLGIKISKSLAIKVGEMNSIQVRDDKILEELNKLIDRDDVDNGKKQLYILLKEKLNNE